MNAVAVIPARWGSSRFPGKALAEIAGKPMIVHVVERASKCNQLAEVIVATDDQRIAEVIEKTRATVAMTGEAASGSDRIADVVRQRKDIDIVVNIQGDEPLIDPDVISAIIDPFEHGSKIRVTTAARHFSSDEDPTDPNRVKVVTDKLGDALYFSRSLIPHGSAPEPLPLHHIGIYGYRRQTLIDFASLPVSPLEECEKLEQLRLLENAIPIRVIQVNWSGLGVDSPSDISLVEERLKTVNI